MHRIVPQISADWSTVSQSRGKEQAVGAEVTAIRVSLSWDWGVRQSKYNFITA